MREELVLGPSPWLEKKTIFMFTGCAAGICMFVSKFPLF